MAQNIRMIAFDLDDTALDFEKKLRPEVAKALAEAAHRGYEVLPATGRMLNGIPEAVLAIPGIRYAITSNGAKIHHLPAKRAIYSNCLEKPLALRLLREAQQSEGFISVFLGGTSYTPHPSAEMLRGVVSPAVLAYLKASRIYAKNLAALIEESEDGVEKLNINYPDEATQTDARRHFSAIEGLSISSSMGLNLELNAPGANKGAALLWLAGQLNIAPAQVMAVGDSENDAAMLQAAGYGVAMGSAPEALRRFASAVAPTAEEAGLAVAVRKVIHQ